jgi:hypothetical protein
MMPDLYAARLEKNKFDMKLTDLVELYKQERKGTSKSADDSNGTDGPEMARRKQ